MGERDRFAGWLNEVYSGPREPQQEAELLTAAAAYDAAVSSGTLTATQLDTLVAAASSRYMLVWANATDLLGKMACRDPAAAEALIRMSQSPRWQVRFNGLCSLRGEIAQEIATETLRRGLQDKSGRVRAKAAQYVEQLDRRDLLPDLEGASEREIHPKTRESIDFHLRMLRDGAIVTPTPEGRVGLFARTRSGYLGRQFSAEEFQQKGVRQIIAELDQGQPVR